MSTEDELKAENARLKAEVEEARKISGAGMKVMLDLNNQLVVEVERLRKAVDEMLGDYKETGVIFPTSVIRWNAAKEGRPNE